MRQPDQVMTWRQWEKKPLNTPNNRVVYLWTLYEIKTIRNSGGLII